jgi:RNA polymerase sigma-70 factor (ECF subfamily)
VSRVGLSPTAGGSRRPWRRDRPAIDARIKRRFRDGDPEAVRVVYREYSGLVYALARRILADRRLCEEATQQTFLNAWRASAGLDLDRELGPWLASIARRAAIDVHRREAARAVGPLDAVAPEHPELIAPPPAAEDAYDAWEVRQAVSRLEPEQRDIVRLQHFEGLTHAEIAARLQLPLGTVKSRSFRAHRQLAAGLGHLRNENQTGSDRCTSVSNAHL